VIIKKHYTMKAHYLAAVVFGLLFFQPLAAQSVWPGDVNNNGIVNGIDLLYWGTAIGSTGPQRVEVSGEWQAQPLPPLWSQSFPDGVNYAYADCDGSGVVDDDDFDDAIEDNFGLTHGTVTPDTYDNAAPGTAPRLRLQPDAEIVQEGAIVNIGLSLDDSRQPIADFYGIAMQLSYTTGLLEGDDGPDFDLVENSWINADGSAVQEIFVDNDGQGLAELAITRTNQQTVPVGPGEFGRFSIVIEDIIVGLEIDTFILRIDSVRLINANLESTPVTPDTARIIISRDEIVSTKTPASEQSFRVYPNPAGRELYVETQQPIQAFRLINNLGKSIPIEARQIDRHLYYLQRPKMPVGVYWLSGNTNEAIIIRKIILFNH